MFRRAIQAAVAEPTTSFPPPLLYGGPGFARFWRDLERSARTSEHRGNFKSGIPRATEAALRPLRASDIVTIVDLGIGTLDSGKQVYNLLEQQQFKIINYVGVDISMEMLHHATSEMRHMAQASNVHCINSDFYELHKIKTLLPDSDRKIFLLLGNTLGNEPDAERLLKEICDVMGQDDRLILEIQLLSEAPTNEPVLDKFYIGPFLYAGFRTDEMECRRQTDASSTDQLVSFVVKTKTSKQLAQPRDSFTIEAGNYTSHVVRKFSAQSIKDIVENSNLKFDYPEELPKDEPSSGARRFGYFVLRK
jgi:SAM-dependent methyltransferase